MNSVTPTFIEDKVAYVKKSIDELELKLASKKEDKTHQLPRISFIAFLDETIEKLQALIINHSETFNAYSENNYPKSKNVQLIQYREKYFQSEKERLKLEKKLTDLMQRQIRQQEHALKLERAESESLKEKARLQSQIRQLQQENQQVANQLTVQEAKNKDQEKEIHRIATLNHRLNNEKEKIIDERNRAEKKLNELIQKYQEEDDFAIYNRQLKGYEKFYLKNTEGIKIVRYLTNISNEKKNMEKYFILSLPARMQLQKIVYGIRIGIVMPNKHINYFNDIYLYEKDPIRLEKQGDFLVIQYLKRKQRIVLTQQKLVKPQVLILLYGKGDSVMIDQTLQA